MTASEATIALGRRALAAGFRNCTGGVLVLVTEESGAWEEYRFTGDADDAWIEEREGVPLFTDAATLGVLEAQVRAKHRDLQARVLVAYRDGSWPQRVTMGSDDATFKHFCDIPDWLTPLRRHSEEVGALLVRAYQLRMVPDDAEAEGQSMLALVAALEARP